MTRASSLVSQRCSNLDELPENSGSLECLQELCASGTAIHELPTSIKHLTSLTLFNLKDCKNLLRLADAICTSLTSLQILNLSGCSNLNELPENLGSFKCLQELDASGTAISQVPKTISQLSQLGELVLNGCSKLQSLPKFPSSIRGVAVQNCPLLQGTHSNTLTVWASAAAGFSYINCQNDNDKAQAIWLPDEHLLWPFYQRFFEVEINRGIKLERGHRSNNIPAWLSRCSNESTITISLPLDLNGKRTWMGLALCFVCVATHRHDYVEDVPQLDEEFGVQFNRNHRIELNTTEDPHERPVVVNYSDCDLAGPFIHWCYIPRSGFVERITAGPSTSLRLWFYFCLSERLEWFSEQSIVPACTVNLPLPPNLHNDENWAGISLYVVCKLPTGVQLSRTFYKCHLYTPTEATGCALLMHRLMLVSPWDDKVGSHRLLIIHIPRVCFPERLNQCHFIQALFGCATPGVKVEMCGMHLVYNQDLIGLIQTITHCTTLTGRPVYYGAAKSSEHSSVEAVCPPFKPTDFRSETGSAKDETTTSTQIVTTFSRKRAQIVQEEVQEQETTTSTWIVDELRINVVSLLLEKLFEERLEWFSEHSSSLPCTVNLDLPPNLHNNENWAGLSLYVVCSLPPGVPLSRIFYECHLGTPIDAAGPGQMINRLTLCAPCDNMGSHRLLIIYVPRVRFPERLNWCHFIQALFACRTRGVEVEMSGMRLVYKEDLKGLIHTITHCTTLTHRSIYYGTGDYTDNEKHNGISLGATSLQTDLLKAATSTEHSSVSEVCPPFIFRPQMHSAEDTQHERSIINWEDRSRILYVDRTTKKLLSWLSCEYLLSHIALCQLSYQASWFCNHLYETEMIETIVEHIFGVLINTVSNDDLKDFVECKNLLTLPDVICTYLTSLQILNLSGCSNLNELPENLGSLKCLQELYASGTAISQVPESISQLSQLGELVLDGCSKLQSLPQLPFSIRAGAIQRDERFEYGYRSNEIPAWLSRRSTESTITIPLPHDVDGKSKWIKLALCFICEAAQKDDSLEDVPEFDEELGLKFTRNHLIELCTTEDPHERLLALDYRDCNFAGPFIHWCFIPQSDLAESSNKRLIQATITPDSPGTRVTGCGASLIYLEDVPKFVRKLNKHYSYCYQGYQPEQEEDGMRSIPSTSGVQTEQEEVQEQETTTSTRIRGLPNLYDYGFIFCLRERLPWFSEQSSTSACTVNLRLPPNLHNNEKWAGLSLYVVCALPPGLPLFRTFYECHLYTPIEAVGHEQLMHRLMLSSSWDDNVGSHRLLIIHIPRVRFPERLNRCHFIQALFGCRTPGVEVEMCGMRLVYNQDFKGLIQTIAHCTNDRPAYYGTGDFTDTKKYKGISLGVTSLLTNLLEAAKSSEHSSVSEVCPPFMPIDFRRETYSAEDSQHERKTTPIHPLQYFGSAFDPTNNMSSDQNQLLDFEREMKYNSCFPPNEIVEWFGHQSSGPSVKIPLPLNLCEDTNWIGLALCAYFSVLDHSTTDLDNLNPEISHNLTCLLETDEGCLESLHGYCTNSQEFEWLYRMGGFIWLSYIPRCWFSDQLKERGHLEASIGSDRGSLGVHRCGLRLIYLEDEEGLKETIMHCMTSLSDINQGKDKQYQNCEAGSSSITGSNVNFGCHLMYNSCFPSSITLEWFGDQSSGSSIRVPLPPHLYSATNWIGLALCASFSIVENPTADLDNLNPEISHHLICHLESDRGTIEPLHDYCTTNEEFQWLPFGGFIWVSYIPRVWFSDQLNECDVLEASFVSDHEAFTVHECGLRLVYQHDEEEIKQTILHYMTSLSDKKGKNMQCPTGDAGSSSRPSSYIVKPHVERLGRPKWFSHQSNDSSATVLLPHNLNLDSNWKGLAVCAYFSVLEHPTVDIDNLDIPAISHHLIYFATLGTPSQYIDEVKHSSSS
ncbi:hypothetical protein ACE6H2_023667 [Prunus campanulata]